MAENPLLPHRKLQELHALMVHCRALARSARTPRTREAAREAWLAATTIHLLPGDVLSTGPNDTVAESLAPLPRKPSASALIPAPPKTISRLALAAAAARGLQAAGTEGLVLAYTHSGSVEPGWAEALAWAHAANVPLLLACTDFTSPHPQRGPRTRPGLLTATTLSHTANRLGIPVVTVDGEDAVAVYRVMQESVLRARQGGGPAILWSLLSPPTRKLPRSQLPLARLEAYLRARNIKPSH